MSWLLMGFVWWLFTKKQPMRKKLGWFLVIWLFVFSNRALNKTIAWQWQAALEWPELRDTMPAGVLLTGMTFTDQRKRSYFGANADRFIQTAKLYKTGAIRKVIISGGTASLLADRPSESKFLASQLLELGVPAADIITESNSRNTHENAVQSKRILDSLGMHKPVMLITSAMHMKRAVACFQKQGILVVPWPASVSIPDNHINWKMVVIPELATLLDWPSLNKEMIGYLSYKITGKL